MLGSTTVKMLINIIFTILSMYTLIDIPLVDYIYQWFQCAHCIIALHFTVLLGDKHLGKNHKNKEKRPC
ncbi:Transmembrane protein (mitochondrion) [Coccomyxa sp. Obi]|nr:Transmembrane protein [Coccomyxa sp. Obi]